MARCAFLAFLPLYAARSVVLAFLGHSEGSYEGLLEELRSEGLRRDLEILWPEGHFKSFEDMQGALKELLQEHPDAHLVYMGHGMEGGAAAQAFAAASEAEGLVLLAGFLQRRWRPDVEACGRTWAKQPSVVCPKVFCPGGYLKDGVHDCSSLKGGVVYPLPSLSIGGELDGVVRVSRLAEAWYTQRNSSHLVRVVPGMSHADLLSQVPPALVAKDLPSTCGPKKARLQVAQLVVDFLTFQVVRSFEENFFEPWKEMFLLEGSWWWTGNSDESGSSNWAARAQQRLVDPLPSGFTWGKAQDDFHLLSDEELIPPYYRLRHRPKLFVENSTVSSRTVTQLRYVELSVLQVAAGLNGWAVIKEEKAAQSALQKDDGGKAVAAIEIATKMCSRQKAFELCGAEASPELDQGDRSLGFKSIDYAKQANAS